MEQAGIVAETRRRPGGARSGAGRGALGRWRELLLAATVLASASWGVAPTVEAASGAPDSHGYTWTDSADGCERSIPAFGAGAQSFLGASAPVGPFPLPFAFDFYEDSETELHVDPKGFVSFSVQPSGPPQSLPVGTQPNHLIAPFWVDAPDADLTIELTPDWVHVAWSQSIPGSPGLPATDIHLVLWPHGGWTYQWGDDGGLGQATVGYEDGTGGRGRLHYRSLLMRESGFPRPTAGATACVWPPSRLDCSGVTPLSCPGSFSLNLPTAGSFADRYACASGSLDANELVVFVELTEFTTLDLVLSEPSWSLIELSPPPDCDEWRCLGASTGELRELIRSPGTYWFAIDASGALPGTAFQLDVECGPFGTPIACGETVFGDTSAGSRFFDDRGCATAGLEGPELAFRFSLAADSDISLELVGAATDTWLVLHDAAGFDANGGDCIRAGRGGLGASRLPAGDYVVVVDSESDTGTVFELTLTCGGDGPDCGTARQLGCGQEVAGDTSSGRRGTPAWPCSGSGFAGAEEYFLLRNPFEQDIQLQLLESTPGQRLVLLRDCTPEGCHQVGKAPGCRRLPPGDYWVGVDGPLESEGPFRLRWDCGAATTGVDLRVSSIDLSALTGSCSDLEVSGRASVTIANLGEFPAAAPFSVILVEDLDLDGQVGPADEIFGQASATEDLAPGVSRTIAVEVSGRLTFRDKPLLARVDASDEIAEFSEANNLLLSAASCEYRPPAGSLAPVVAWEWTSSPLLPEWNHVRMMPTVGDLDGDGLPEVVFTTATSNLASGEGVLRALSGADGSELWTVTDPSARVHAKTQVAIADLDGDGAAEILALSHADNTRLLAFDADGSLRWTSDAFVSLPPDFPAYGFGAPAVGDLDGNGTPEIAWGAEAIDAAGQRFWTAQTGGTVGNPALGVDSLSSYTIIADVNEDGRAEVIAGPSIYRYDDVGGGELLWRSPGVADGSTAVTDLDGDGSPEVIVMSARTLQVLEGSDGALRWSAELTEGGGGCPPGGVSIGGVPTIADFDGDCAMEVGVVSAEGFSVFGPEGELEWQVETEGCDAAVGGGATAFDFEGDGVTEILLLDAAELRVLDGRNGEVLSAVAAPSRAGTQLAVVADVNGDEAAEVLIPLSDLETGLRLVADGNDDWANTRAVWNQHSYHVDNIADDLTVPSPEARSWETHRTYRTQLDESRATLAPDLTMSIVGVEGLVEPDCDRLARVTARVGNAGPINVGRPFEARLYEGDPAAGGTELTSLLLDDLAAGDHRDVVLTVPLPRLGVLEIHALADDAGLGVGTIRECREDNNACSVTLENPPDGLVRPDPVGNALRATGHGPADSADVSIDLDWSLDEGGPRSVEHFHVLRGVDPRDLRLLSAFEPLLATALTDDAPRAATTPLVHFYRVLAADTCEQISED